RPAAEDDRRRSVAGSRGRSLLKTKNAGRPTVQGGYAMTFSKLAAITLAAACLCGPAHAEEHYPSRLITIVAPITAGTAIDIMARLYADKLSKQFGQQVVVANRAGAAGMIGAQAVANAPA